jgi:cyanophycin synthetase
VNTSRGENCGEPDRGSAPLSTMVSTMKDGPSDSGMRLVADGVSVYEVEVDLGRYAGLASDRIKDFAGRLVRLFPGLRKHECYAGETGGFLQELNKGTDLAHVMEHLILEMLKTACGRKSRFTGWTRKKRKSYVIHFQAPDGSMARCAALSAMQVIEDIIQGKKVHKKSIIQCIRDSREVRV